MSRVLSDPVPEALEGEPPTAGHDGQAPGERRFRHPGDVVRLALWGTVTLVLAALIAVATSTSEGVTTDVGRVVTRLPGSVREFLLGLIQIAALAVPLAVVIGLVVKRRWHRLLMVAVAGAAGAGLFALLDAGLSLHRQIPDGVTGDTWVLSSRFPSLPFLAAAAAVATLGKPWLSRSWRRSCDWGVVVLAGAMAIAGTAGVPEVALAVASGAAAGAAVLVVFGAPNRRPAPATVAGSLREAGLPVTDLALQLAPTGRAQRYVATMADGPPLFVKVYAQDARDADLLYRSYRTLMLRGPGDERPSTSLAHDVEHQALLLMLARRAGVRCPEVEALARLGDGSVALALECIDGELLDDLPPDQIDDSLLDAVWREVATIHAARLAHRALRAGNILVAAGRPTIIDLSFGEESATPRSRAIDRAELLTSLAALVGTERALASAARVLDSDDLATALPYLQPLALSASTRRQVSKGLLTELRNGTAEVTGEEVPPLERLVRVRPRTLMTVVVLTGAFYLLLPQLANVDDSVRAMQSANWAWVAVCIVVSGLTYVASAIGMAGGVPERLPFVPTVMAQLASSFVNRVTPANVGGMALNVRFMQKSGVDSGAAVTGMGLNVVAGGDRARRPAGRLLRLGGSEQPGRLRHPVQQQASRRHRRRPGVGRHRGRDRQGSPPVPDPRPAVPEAVVAEPQHLGPIPVPDPRALRRVVRRDAGVRRARSSPRARRSTPTCRSPRSVPCTSGRRSSRPPRRRRAGWGPWRPPSSPASPVWASSQDSRLPSC